jgi:23S rRNA G2069 N7-methylase RlmK/C1962 C5-methylase RlmI
LLADRLKKRHRQLRKWAKRRGISCFRLYERDIPEFPCIVDWYDGEAVVWVYRRKKDETPKAEEEYVELTLSQCAEGLGLEPSAVHVKERFRQRTEEGVEQYGKFGTQGRVKVVEEQGLKFEVNLSDFLDTGLFLDHRVARSWIRDEAKGKRVLNLFSYTGSFSAYAMAGEAKSVTTVDMSKTYCAWAKKNLELNGLDMTRHELVASDVLSWIKKMKGKGRRFDLIICDPPTFSNSKRMEESSFSIERDHPWLLADLMTCLEPGGKLFFSNNARKFKLDLTPVKMDWSVEEMSEKSVPEDFRNRQVHRSWWIEHSV